MWQLRAVTEALIPTHELGHVGRKRKPRVYYNRGTMCSTTLEILEKFWGGNAKPLVQIGSLFAAYRRYLYCQLSRMGEHVYFICIHPMDMQSCSSLLDQRYEELFCCLEVLLSNIGNSSILTACAVVGHM
jgi:hypothetical protein